RQRDARDEAAERAHWNQCRCRLCRWRAGVSAPTADGYGSSRYVCGIGREEPGNGVCYLLWLPYAAQCDRGEQSINPVAVAAGSLHLGIDKTRSHAVDPDALRSHFAGEPDGQAVDRALARSVVDVLACSTEQGC